MYGDHETDDGAGRAAPGAGSGAGGIAGLRKQLESLGRFVFGCAVVATAVLAYLVAQSLVTSRDLAVLGRDSGTINAKLDVTLDTLSTKLTGIDEALTGLADLYAELQPPPGDGALAPPAPGNWTGVLISDLGPLLPYLASVETETGQVWIHSENEAFLARISEALQSLEDAGMNVDIEQSE